jgi:hypothetical protein
MKNFKIGEHEYLAEDCCDGVLINPSLPLGFMLSSKDELGQEICQKWFHVPFIVRDIGELGFEAPLTDIERQAVKREFLNKWPSGVIHKYFVLDDASHYGPSLRGVFDEMKPAIASAHAWLMAIDYDS